MNATVDIENYWSACPELHLGWKDLPFLKGFPGGTSSKESTCQHRSCKRRSFDLWVGKIPRRRKCKPIQYSCLRNPMDRGAWWTTYNPWGLKELDTTEWLRTAHSPFLNQPSSPLGVLGVEMCAWDFLQCNEVYPWPWMRESVFVSMCVWCEGEGGGKERRLKKLKWKLLSSVQLFATPWTMQSMEFSRPEYWSG